MERGTFTVISTQDTFRILREDFEAEFANAKHPMTHTEYWMETKTTDLMGKERWSDCTRICGWDTKEVPRLGTLDKALKFLFDYYVDNEAHKDARNVPQSKETGSF